MNKFAIVFAIIMTVCAASNIKCTEKQKQAIACTYEYEPVCGVKLDEKSQYIQKYSTYGNKCQACGEEGVEFYAVGECQNYPENAIFCHPEAYLQPGCTRELNPVCGYFDESFSCSNSVCSSNYSNRCSACINQEVSYVLQGFCQ
ncbi:kazal-type proteinase inhibitor 1 (macronuclear) [Tetrahymena thermophila SB210]|uniref:Kazal-type proteinase inhibitor 1 n=1 Tax=Tetrahymena thermophila (strain SB210) TaxID=312017 RepID=Q23RZ1_TETTS|nr:kazal-type proteinase inhibitor 1 [Tetrahymena thermophila SB210]EAR99248.1 kazal-type proteinase inhibitor 1 [Tetrahymena thermophila SB210]|eukprot:XP_001019493.1 kazal-type proteinase inhibitor 1 [Tetrahymena thermophila SB210]